MTARILHFTLGPVQDFIEQARRTRDFWAGSFILSLLSGHAMKALREKGGVIVFPKIEADPLFEAICGKGGEPHVGSLPNRFKANIDNVQGDAGMICKKAVDAAWHKLCASVWRLLFEQGKLAPAAQRRKDESRKIWDRQVNSFWDMAWVSGPEPDGGTDGAWLDIRKSFRSHMPKQEGGDLCRLMGQYQEISGYDRIRERVKQQEFWAALSNDRKLDLPPDERLCAIALVKRFFPVAAEKNKGIDGAMPWVPGGKNVSTRHWPSTSYIAAVPWLKRVADAKAGEWQDLPDLAEKHLGRDYKGETRTALYGLPDDELFTLDGHLLHRDGIVSLTKERFPDDGADRKKAAKDLDAALVDLAAAVDPPGKPVFASEFYAILRMDGDGVGKLMGEPRLVPGIAAALSNFASSVTDYFSPDGADRNESFGALIYAGGDDVLALLPVDTAIEAARHIEVLYKRAFAAVAFKPDDAAKFTISAAIIYAHFKNPLSAALRQSARLLDDIAKEKNGRSSLALAVMKPGGMAAQWVSTFDTAVDELEQLSRRSWGPKENAGLSGSFFHGLAQTYQPLFTGTDGETTDFSDNDVLKSLVIAQMVNQFGGGKERREVAAGMIEPVMAVLRPCRRDKSGTPVEAEGVAFDGGLAVRFLRSQRRTEPKQ
jgi:CRISPR-associated protein Cmr2